MAVTEQLGAHDVGGEVPVAEREPVRPGAVGGQLIADGERLGGAAPAPGPVQPPARGGPRGRRGKRADLHPPASTVIRIAKSLSGPRTGQDRDPTVTRPRLDPGPT